MTQRGGQGRSGWTRRVGIRLYIRGRGRSPPLLIAEGGGAGVVVWA